MSSNPASTLDSRGLPPAYDFRPDWEITPRQTKARLDAARSTPPASPEDHIILLDCRRPEEWAAGRIPGAIHIAMDQIERRADELELDDADPPHNRSHLIAVYCHTGRRSLRVAAALRAMGFPNAFSVAGGIELWSIDIDPSIPRY